MMRINVNVCLFRRNRFYLVPHLGPFTEQKGKVSPTPQYFGKKVGRLMAAFQLPDNQQVTLAISATDKKGNPATLPAGSVTWAVDQVSLIALTPAADGMSAVASAVGPLGTATVSVKVVDGSGNTIASGTLDIAVIGSGATTIIITPGTPTNQP